MTVLREFPARGASPSGLRYGYGYGYGYVDDAVLRAIDPCTGEHLGATEVPGWPTGVTWDGRRIRHCDFPARAITALHPPPWRRT
jgi:hypothetical protein